MARATKHIIGMMQVQTRKSGVDEAHTTMVVCGKRSPEGHGDTTRTVRLTLAERRGESLSNTEKGIVNAVPKVADAVSMPHGLKPSL